jgi:hypothetical protein
MKEVLKSELNRARGSSSLSLIGATSLGIFLTMGVANLAGYLTAKNALDQSVRAAARCLSPSDPKCIELSNSFSSESNRYFLHTTTPSADTFGRVIRYQATMYQEELEGELPYYRTPQQLAPSFALQSATLPTATFERVPSYSRFVLSTRYVGSQNINYAAPVLPRFPAWSEGRERSLEDTPFAAQSRESGFREIFSLNFSLSIREGEERFVAFSPPGRGTTISSFTSGEEETVSCLEGARCTVADLASASGSGGANDYRSRRYAAVYVEVQLSEVSGAPLLGIQGVDGRPGLFLERLNSAGGRIQTYSLGGRDLESIRGKRSFNLWLRGPRGSHGGERGITYSDLLFALNDRLRPIVNLRAQGGTTGGSIRGTVKVYAFVDTYETRTVRRDYDLTCSPVDIPLGSTVEAARPAAQSCGAPQGVELKAEDTLQVVEVGCVAPSATLWPEGMTPTGIKTAPESVTVAMCRSTDRPRAGSKCGWRKITDGGRTMPIARRQLLGCPLAQVQRKVIPCFGKGGEVVPVCQARALTQDTCPAVQAELGQNPLPANIELPLDLGDVPLVRVEGGIAEDKLGCEEVSFAGEVCSLRELNPVSYGPSFVRADGTKQPDPLSAVAKDKAPACHNFTPVNLRAVKEPAPVRLDKYPFLKEGVVELLPLLPKPDGRCEVPRPMEEVLREYAALAGYTAANDPAVRFDYKVEDTAERRLVSRTEGCNTTVVSEAGSCNLLSSVPNQGALCQQTVELGVFSATPEQCLGANCFTVPVPAEEVAHHRVGVEKAVSLGEQIFSRYLPGKKPQFEISIGEDNNISLRARYPWTLSWPLKDLLGRDQLILERSVTERMEAL